ncbi:MAG: hypothetical protein E6J90_30850 [Deltaproteobacteria bacterium]|nr:MAG: hypothetical protein E6J90_30850 [Deltaproteobacteria bacterium]
MTAKSDRSYKRSWKNLLINKRYQLRFTLFMVGISALLMAGLGIWVMAVANETTKVSKTSVRGDACPKLRAVDPNASADEEEPIPPPPMRLEERGSAAPAAPATPPSQPAPAAPPPGDGERHVRVQIDESSMTLTTPPPAMHRVPPPDPDRIAAHWVCELRQVATLDRLERGRLLILWVMIATGVALVLGLAIYGIKMTHRVAGPLFKVSLYLSKMREGRFDKVYNLRKGDQLVDFYDQFKLAHGGVVAMQQADITRLTAVIAAAEAEGLGQHPVVAELRELARRKERSIE